MTMKDFLKNVQDYYGQKYPEGQKPFIAKYLGQFNERALDHLFAKTLTTISSKYKTLPDIATWEELRADIKKLMESEQLEADLRRPAIEDKSEFASPEQIAALNEHFKKTILKGRV